MYFFVIQYIVKYIYHNLVVIQRGYNNYLDPLRLWRIQIVNFKENMNNQHTLTPFVFKTWIYTSLILPLILLLLNLILKANISMAIINRYTDSGQVNTFWKVDNIYYFTQVVDFSWYTQETVECEKPPCLQFLTHSNRCAWHLLPYPVQRHLNILSCPFTL